MKLLYIVNRTNETTGVERILALKSDFLIENYGYDITFLKIKEEVSDTFFDFNKNTKFQSVSLKGISIKNWFSLIHKLNKALSYHKPDCVIVCVDDALALFLPQFLKYKCPIIYERHNSISVNLKARGGLRSKIKNSIVKKLLEHGGKHFDAFVVLSVDNKKEWNHLHNVIVINNPLIFYPEKSAELKNKKVLAIGRHTHQKGFDMLMHSWEKVNKAHPDWELDVYGQKSTDYNLTQIAEDMHMADSVNIHDPIKNIQDVYMESSIFVLSSRYEGFVLVLIEAMSCGLPVISFDCPNGPKEIISHEVDGILVEPNNTDLFADKIISLIKDEDLRNKMGTTGKKNIARLRPENILLQWDKLFRNLIGNRE